jgi:hypothetical protein
MSALPKFECRVPADGYRVLSFDQRKVCHTAVPPLNLTEDERYWWDRWGMPPVYGKLGVVYLLDPKSERIRCSDLFEETAAPYLEFANSPATLEGAKALANRFGPLCGPGPEYVHDWCAWIKDMRGSVIAWEKAKATADFSPIIRIIARRTRRLRISPGGGIDANISLSKDPVSGRPRLRIRLNTLLDALFSQLALAIDGSESLHTCVECRKWFAIKAGRGRSDKEYCSDACRMRAYRKRKGKH